jgi:hypothetical protein
MSKRILTVVTCAYRATLEEQDDPILWLTRAMRGAGAPVDVLLWGNAVSYGVRAQDAGGLCFGEKRQTQPPRLADDGSALIESGAALHYATADAHERGIDASELIAGLKPVEPSAIPRLLSTYDLVLWW